MYTFYFAMLAECRLQQDDLRSDDHIPSENTRTPSNPSESLCTDEGRRHEQAEAFS